MIFGKHENKSCLVSKIDYLYGFGELILQNNTFQVFMLNNELPNIIFATTLIILLYKMPFFYSYTYQSINYLQLMSIHDRTKSFCSSLIESIVAPKTKNGPIVTLTYAQSLDCKISGHNGQQLALSCEESFIMTHRLRILHDGILVGIGTILNDNPRLTARLLGPDELESTISQPRPIILDSQLRFPLSSNVLKQSKMNGYKSPLVFTSYDHDSAKRKLLEQEGAVVVPIESNKNGQLSIAHLLSILSSPPFSICRLMVEGGAKVIKSFLKSNMVDLLIITIAPTFVGVNGILAVDRNSTENQEEIIDDLPKLTNVKYEQFGRDIVLAAHLLS